MPCCHCQMNRREFLEISSLGLAAAGLAAGSMSFAGKSIEEWDPNQALKSISRTLTIQPVLMYQVAEPAFQRSYKSWGDIQSDAAAKVESERIAQELQELAKQADFPVQISPLRVVKTEAEAAAIHTQPYDIILLYPASGSGTVLRACFAPKGDTIIFVRQRSGAVYYWYEALSTRILETSATDPVKPVHVDDVVVDDYEDVLWRLRALCAVKSLRGSGIVAMGGVWGKYAEQAPQIARDKFQMNLIEVSYEELTRRVQAARKEKQLVQKAKAWTDKYLAIPKTTLNTKREFVDNSFFLYWVFKDLMQENNVSAFTIKSCMGTVMPIAETTACMALGILMDEGYAAFCESDFVVIPGGILMRHITGKPVFLHNSTFPHKGEVTCAHCVGPRRMDGVHYDPVEITTHYESEYGAAPKVDIPVGQKVTFLDPEYSSGRWLGFTGTVQRNPYYQICRSQQDVLIDGNWQKLKNEARDSHWLMVYGDYMRELGYAARKLGMRWDTLGQAV
jgi:L-fucose isomerase-like protein